MELINKSGRLSEDEINRLWQNLREGNRSALDSLFREFYDELFTYSHRIVSDEELVKDSIQELFLELWQRRESLSKAASVKAYLLVSIRRLILNSLQKEKNRYTRNRKYIDNLFEEDFTLNQIVFDNDADKKKKKELLQVLNQLNSKQKETIFLRYYHGLSNAEIAKVMDINHQSVKNNLFRVIKSLRAIVKSPSDFIILISLLEQLSV